MAEPIDLGVKTHHYIVSGDLTLNCPHCYTATGKPFGVLSIEGTEHEVAQCSVCTKVFSKLEGGVKALVEEACVKYGTENIAFKLNQVTLSQNQQSNNPSIAAGLTTHGTFQQYSSPMGVGISQPYQPLTTSSSSCIIPLQSEVKIDADTKLIFNEMKEYLRQLKDDHSLQYEIQRLMSKLEALANQNVQLMEKLATDPLIETRKLVSQFNLE